MMVNLINPRNGLAVKRIGHQLTDADGNLFSVNSGIPRFTETDNYAKSFGFQWNKFDKTQLDWKFSRVDLNRRRFFAETAWASDNLSGLDVLEVGSGAGRFSKVVLEHTEANLYSVDYSDAVSANLSNNGHVAPERFHLFQASVYELPFPDNSFDKVFCFGVLQHTPDFDASIKSLIAKTKPGGEVVVDFYPIKGWWTKLNAKYFLRPIAKRIRHDRLLQIIDKNIDWLISAHLFLYRCGLGVLARFLPVCDVASMVQVLNLPPSEIRELVVLDTFDMYSPEHDHPQKISTVAMMFERHGARVTFAGFVPLGDGTSVAVVRGIRKGASVHD